MTLQFSGFIPSLLQDTNKYIEVVNEHHVMAKQKDKFKLKCAAITETLS